MQTLPAPGGEREKRLKKCVVHLIADERAELEGLTRRGSGKARRLKHALVLLAADDGDTDVEIASKLRVHANTEHPVRRRFVEDGLDPALSKRQRPGKAPLLDGHQERPSSGASRSADSRQTRSDLPSDFIVVTY